MERRSDYIAIPLWESVKGLREASFFEPGFDSFTPCRLSQSQPVSPPVQSRGELAAGINGCQLSL